MKKKVKARKEVSPGNKRTPKPSLKERLLHYLKRKYTNNLEPGSSKSSLTQKKDEAAINPNK